MGSTVRRMSSVLGAFANMTTADDALSAPIKRMLGELPAAAASF